MCLVTAVISLEYVVFLTAHWLLELRRSVGLFVLLRVAEGLVFHFVVGCTLVAYYKVVFTGTTATHVMRRSIWQRYLDVGLES